MAISVVNGFLCYSSCDAAKAAKGENPHPRADAASTNGAETSRADRPAVILGGALKAPGVEVNVPTPASPSQNATSPQNQSPSIDILA